jgi:hypothetical protein
MAAKLVSRRLLLQTFFLAMFTLGGPFVSVSIAARFRGNAYWRTRQLAIIPMLPYQRALYNIFAYLQELCTVQCSLVAFGHATVDSETFFGQGLSDLWTNYFINGMETRFANFFNWTKVFLTDRRRPINRRRFHTPLWWVHYKEFGGDDTLFQDVGAIILHKYFFRRLVGHPRIFLNKTQIRRDFFVPLPVQTERLCLFSFVYMFVRVFLYYRIHHLASRLFWDSRFQVHENRTSIGFHANVFKFAFTLHGRRYDKMQLWEYASFLDSFVSAGPLAQRLVADEIRYDPK